MGHVGCPARFFNQQHQEDKMLPGECLGIEGAKCPDCKADLKLDIWQSAAGFYIGYWCMDDGPISRETRYFSSEGAAQLALEEILLGGGTIYLRT